MNGPLVFDRRRWVARGVLLQARRPREPRRPRPRRDSPRPRREGLRALWDRVGGSGLVAVAEQYLLMPGYFARKAIVDAGVIGVPTFVEVASTHLYHAISMMRGLLGAGFDPVRVDARAFEDPLAAPGAWARGEAGVPYSLADACQDHLLGLAIEESARTGREVVTEIEAWATGV